MTASRPDLERTPDGELLLGADGLRGIHHTIRAGTASCLPSQALTDKKPLSQVSRELLCRRKACRDHWLRERRHRAAGDPGDVEHVCENCGVERDRDRNTDVCPSCGVRCRAVPETAAAA